MAKMEKICSNIIVFKQELEVKGRRAEIAGVEAEIVQCQETHDRLTAVERRTERLCASRQAQIRSVEETLEELKGALSR